MNFLSHLQEITDEKVFFDSQCIYDTIRWSGINELSKPFIKDFENKSISRKDVIQAYSEYYGNPNNSWRRAFALTMIWGFANNGYGTFRTNKYLSKENEKFIIYALKSVRERDLEAAYASLSEIKGLGVSYISKVLYFATRAAWRDTDRYALIFDIRVARGLVKLAAPQLHGILEIYPSAKFKNYQRYINLMHDTATENRVTAEALELFLFNYAE